MTEADGRRLERVEPAGPAAAGALPRGQIDQILLPLFREYRCDVHQDPVENIVGLIRGRGERAPMVVAWHKDEGGMIVKRVEALAFPGINSHGFEVAPVAGILNMQQLLLAYLTRRLA